VSGMHPTLGRRSKWIFLKDVLRSSFSHIVNASVPVLRSPEQVRERRARLSNDSPRRLQLTTKNFLDLKGVEGMGGALAPYTPLEGFLGRKRCRDDATVGTSR
jgi:hypothetical protein